MTRRISVVIADDHELVLEGMQRILREEKDIDLLGYANNGKELIELVRRVEPEIVLADIKMPIMDGVEACFHIMREFPETHVIAITVFNDERLLFDMLHAGAKGFLLKSARKQEILSAIQTVINGDKYFDNEVSREILRLVTNSRRI